MSWHVSPCVYPAWDSLCLLELTISFSMLGKFSTIIFKKFLIPLTPIIQILVHLIGPGNGTPLQYSCLENPMDGGAWWAAVHGVTKSWTRLSDFTFTFYFHALEKAVAPHSSTLAWKIPWTEEPGGLRSMGSHRMGHDWSDLASSSSSSLEEKLWET